MALRKTKSRATAASMNKTKHVHPFARTKGGWRFASHICAQPKDKRQRITFLIQIIHKFYYNRKIHFTRKREDINYTVTSGLFLKDKAVHLRYDLPDRHIYYFFSCPSKKFFEVIP